MILFITLDVCIKIVCFKYLFLLGKTKILLKEGLPVIMAVKCMTECQASNTVFQLWVHNCTKKRQT